MMMIIIIGIIIILSFTMINPILWYGRARLRSRARFGEAAGVSY